MKAIKPLVRQDNREKSLLVSQQNFQAVHLNEFHKNVAAFVFVSIRFHYFFFFETGIGLKCARNVPSINYVEPFHHVDVVEEKLEFSSFQFLANWICKFVWRRRGVFDGDCVFSLKNIFLHASPWKHCVKSGIKLKSQSNKFYVFVPSSLSEKAPEATRVWDIAE